MSKLSIPEVSPPAPSRFKGIVRVDYKPTPFRGLKPWLEGLKSRGIALTWTLENEDGQMVPRFAIEGAGVLSSDWEIARANREALLKLLS